MARWAATGHDLLLPVLTVPKASATGHRPLVPNLRQVPHNRQHLRPSHPLQLLHLKALWSPVPRHLRTGRQPATVERKKETILSPNLLDVSAENHAQDVRSVCLDSTPHPLCPSSRAADITEPDQVMILFPAFLSTPSLSSVPLADIQVTHCTIWNGSVRTPIVQSLAAPVHAVHWTQCSDSINRIIRDESSLR